MNVESLIDDKVIPAAYKGIKLLVNDQPVSSLSYVEDGVVLTVNEETIILNNESEVTKVNDLLYTVEQTGETYVLLFV